MSDDTTHANGNSADNYDALLNLLYPETIYRFNQAMISLWEDRKLGYLKGNEREQIAWFVAPYFSAHTRTFHWVNIDPSLWVDDEESEKVTATVLKALGEFRSEKLAAFFDQLPSGSFHHETRKMIEEAIASKRSTVSPIKLKRGLLALYSGHHNPADWNIEGVFIRLLVKNGWKEDSDDNPDLDCLKGVLFGEGKVFSWFMPTQSECTQSPLKQWEHCGDPEKSTDVDPCSNATNGVRNADEERSVEVTLYEELLGERDKFQEELRKHPSACLIPLYDHWRGGKGYGGIKAVLMVFLDQHNKDQWLEEKFSVLAHGLAAVSSEIANSAQTMAISRPIEAPYDLMRHFLRVLAFVQDWESATVIDKSTKKVLYRYCREKETESVKWGWVPEEVREEAISQNGAKKDCIEQEDGKYFMWWTTDLWSSDYIPGIGNEELSRFGGMEIRFEFPKASRIPGDEGIRRWLRHTYIRQQLGLLQQLIHKVRTRRAALRSALSAIMGRNMSHNIGSHVLARYSSVVREEKTFFDKERIDHRADFLSYLQKRMDFLAEMATSDRAHWSQGLSLREQVERLNYRRQQERFNKPPEAQANPSEGCTKCAANMSAKVGQNSPILLTYITGKESMLASVEFGNPIPCNTNEQMPGCAHRYRPKPADGLDELRFSCPGGEVGVHALFIILENIIRNSARHGIARRNMVQLFVDASSEGERIKLTIIDPGTELEADGRKRGAENKETPVPEKIRAALEAPFLEPDGKPNPQHWGVREMQICAHYLLGLPLSDLESTDALVLIPDVYTENGLCCLKYELWLLKPRHVAVVRNAHSDAGELPQGLKLFTCGEAVETRDYEFLILEQGVALPEAFHSVVPIRQVQCAPAEMAGLLAKTPDEILATLHAKFVDIYTQKGERNRLWGQPRIASVVGWEPPREGSAPGTRIGDGKVADRMCHVQSYMSSGEMGFVDLPKVLELDVERSADESWNSSRYVGAAWLSHPTDNNFRLRDGSPQAPFFGGAAVPCDESGEPPQVAAWISVEPCWSDSPQRPILEDLRKAVVNASALDAKLRRAVTELTCAAVPRVIVLDERVQSRRLDLMRDVSLYKYWPMVGIWTPFKREDYTDSKFDTNFLGKLATPCCDLDRPCFEDIQAFLTNPTPLLHQGVADFLVIHLTILERLKADRRDKRLNDTLTALVNGTNAEGAVKVVVTGRGVPTHARHANHDVGSGGDGEFLDARFIPISAMLEYLVSRPSKLGLMRVLWSA